MDRPGPRLHGVSRPGARRVVALGLLLILGPGVAGMAEGARRRPAPARVLVLGFDGQTPVRSFVEILKVQVAASRGEVVAASLRGRTASLAARVARATREVEARRARLGVWIERPGGGSSDHVLLCLVGRRQGQLLVEVKEVGGRQAQLGRPEFERGLALKVREVLDAVLEDRAGTPSLARVLAPSPPVSPAPPPEVEPAPPRTPAAPPPASAEPVTPVRPALAVVAEAEDGRRARWVPLLAELGASALGPAGTAGAQAALTGGLGTGLELRGPAGTFELAALAQVRWPTPLAVSQDLLLVSASELVFTGGIRVVRLMGRPGPARAAARFWLGLELQAGARLLSVQGTARGRAEGSAQLTRAVLAPALEGRLQLARWVQLRATVGPELTLVRQQFTLRGLPLLDLGEVRVLGQLFLIFSVP